MPKQTNIGEDKKSQRFNSDTQEAFTEYILKEFKRRREGVWFMNNGEAVYLTPEHYMGMQWNQMADTGGYKEFRMAQANMYYFAKACLIDKRCIGIFSPKVVVQDSLKWHLTT
jgi:hypothetical protein